MGFNNVIFSILTESNFLKGKKTKPLVDAITNRNPITFYYSGPKKPEKDSVLSGTRIKAEAVALGLSKKGNLIVRAYVQPPSVSKKGFTKTKWRTFLVNRMSNINVLTDETFNTKRPGYKEGEESKSGPMSITYVTSKWTETQPTKKEVPPQKQPTPIPTPTKTKELPQPKPDDKPSQVPEYEPKDFSQDIYNKITPIVKDINGEKYITTQEYQNAFRELYKLKEKDWVEKQKQVGGNLKPGEGTRKRFDVTSNYELSNILSKNKINIVDELPQPETEETPDTNLQESIKRIKTLMLL